MVIGAAGEGGPSVLGGRQPLMSFRAGRCIVEGTLVSPDPRKGMLRVLPGERPGLVRIQWYPRALGIVEEETIPRGDTRASLIPNCPARVFVLQCLASAGRPRRLYWLQEPDASKDSSLLARFNQIIGAPSRHQLPPPGPPLAAPPPPQQQQQQQEHARPLQQQQQLRELLRSFADGTRRIAASQRQVAAVSLTKVFDSESVSILSSDEEVMKELAALMPAGYQSRGEALTALRSPQLSVCLTALTHALVTDPAPLLAAMGVPSEVSPGEDPMQAFAVALEQNFASPGAAAAAEAATGIGGGAAAAAADAGDPPAEHKMEEDPPAPPKSE